MTKALFPGSFNPFTIGHLSVAERAAGIFDRLVIAVGVNISKTSPEQIEKLVDSVRKAVAHIENVEVISYNGLTADACRQTESTVIVRGLRNSSDFNYEQQLAEVNRRISGIETVFINSTPELACVSSSMVRELERFGVDISGFLPEI